MQDFLILAGQFFIILCIQSILEVMSSSRRQYHLQKPIALGCYIASLLLVLRFMQQYLADILNSLSRLF
ncbi:hypothetical protein CLNEO_03950 [Anaerotignum neopropionicum]|uniref:DUF1146 domain-containing protein n=1 Tax=Anaerotignum neopropionicum TaxID=36847 RepID=A0A136WIN5_9FIRM|nr:hypothetical protein [Anaerotignum neopropionicum]KXL54168.1 hypothetical protein CLNEO_02660 [Anaerotignum neopropionicum]KXL54293.1 hypothetical protein CLNEO_03950 [Anaerotignum neopropionicum]